MAQNSACDCMVVSVGLAYHRPLEQRLFDAPALTCFDLDLNVAVVIAVSWLVVGYTVIHGSLQFFGGLWLESCRW